MRFIVLNESVFFACLFIPIGCTVAGFCFNIGLGLYFDVLVLRFSLFIHHGSFIERYRTSKLGVVLFFLLVVNTFISL
jgi:hypothetical protein